MRRTSRRLLVGTTLALAATLLVVRAVPAPFRLTLQQDASGYHATCQEGCRWTELHATPEAGAALLITDAGVFLGVQPPPEAPRFAFRVRRGGSGWEAEAVTGTGWRALGWQCEPSTCVATLTHQGVRTGG
jgi:hypothetical protein